MKTWPDKQKLREFATIRPELQEMLKGILQGEMKRHYTVIWRNKNLNKGEYMGNYKSEYYFNNTL